MYSEFAPSNSVVLTSLPSKGPYQAPCAIPLIAHAPYWFPGILDEQSDISSGTRIFFGEIGGDRGVGRNVSERKKNTIFTSGTILSGEGPRVSMCV